MAELPTWDRDWDDAALVRAVRDGNVECFAPLVDRHLAAVRTFLSLKAPVPHLVDEVSHETFLFAYRRLADFEPGTSFRHWLRAIAWNLLRAEVLRFSRREARFTLLDDSWMLAHSSESQHDSSPDEDFLEDCCAALPDESRTLIDLYYREGNNSNEIAARLERSRPWVRTTLFRIRQQLRSCIEGKRAAALRPGIGTHG